VWNNQSYRVWLLPWCSSWHVDTWAGRRWLLTRRPEEHKQPIRSGVLSMRNSNQGQLKGIETNQGTRLNVKPRRKRNDKKQVSSGCGLCVYAYAMSASWGVKRGRWVAISLSLRGEEWDLTLKGGPGTKTWLTHTHTTLSFTLFFRY
jgi:hypothetical protein